MKKNLRKNLVNFFVFPITLLALFLHIYLTLNSKNILQPVFAYFEKSETPKSNSNFFCKPKKVEKLKPEFSRAIELSIQRLYGEYSKENFLVNLADCVDIQYANLNSNISTEKIDGKFESLDGKDGFEAQILIDESYKTKDDLLLSFTLIHELTHAEQFFNFKKDWKLESCIDREAEAFNEEINLFTSLSEEEKASLFSKIKDIKKNDSTLASLNQLIGISIKSALNCKKMDSEKLVSCYKKSNLNALKKIISNNKNYIAECSI